MTDLQPKTPIIVMGVSGSGKSTVGRLLADRMGRFFYDADDLHSADAVERMTRGESLTDDDRWPWLDRVADQIAGSCRRGSPPVVACSALRRAYRERLQARSPASIFFVHLSGGAEVLARRMATRAEHFMPTSLLTSQLDTLEPLEDDEHGASVLVTDPPEHVVTNILRKLGAGEFPPGRP
ncbi:MULTISPECIES: gluconokinase [unclassified Microbacterium]|uniref:gluconokinase n=1 Tax=unclassified Microbacterium TaxID=2609290 RepID=UPI00214B074C|nr:MULTISPECIES: gluconokinase [unclassified Microbacterium]MCR2811139.1 gluconokinase [Microbacterium sp. zg.B185]WIM20747.1 gluconokinase [Microbacterium sp. zg-B185]